MKKLAFHFSGRTVILAGILAVFCSLYLEMMREAKIYYLTGAFTGILNSDYSSVPIPRMAFRAICIFLALYFILSSNKVLSWIDRYRFAIAAVILGISLLFRLSGSSLAEWPIFFGNKYGTAEELRKNGVLYGIPRAIRTDEYVIFTPFNFSQRFNGFRAVSEIIRGVPTDVTTTYGLASLSLVTLFRPFLWGYFFGNAFGLSFFWTSRLLALFLISYEFGKMLTGGEKYIAVCYAVLLTFSPVIQWWYAVNGIVEMFFFGQAGILLFRAWFSMSFKRKILTSLGLAWCVEGFVFTYYPALEIPLAYVFVAVLAAEMITLCRCADSKKAGFQRESTF